MAMVGTRSHPKKLYKNLLIAYTEPHRHYHTLDHIAHSQEQLEKVKHLVQHPYEIAAANWFHDAVYSLGADYPENELNSANFAFDSLTREGVDNDVCDRIFDLINATDGRFTPETLDQKFMRDIDYSILGSSPKEYGKYAHAIEKEFVPKMFSKQDFSVLRSQSFLKKVLASPEIFLTPEFKKIEPQARMNLQEEYDWLSK